MQSGNILDSLNSFLNHGVCLILLTDYCMISYCFCLSFTEHTFYHFVLLQMSDGRLGFLVAVKLLVVFGVFFLSVHFVWHMPMHCFLYLLHWLALSFHAPGGLQVGKPSKSKHNVLPRGSLQLKSLTKEDHGEWECVATNVATSITASTHVQVIGTWIHKCTNTYRYVDAHVQISNSLSLATIVLAVDQGLFPQQLLISYCQAFNFMLQIKISWQYCSNSEGKD